MTPTERAAFERIVSEMAEAYAAGMDIWEAAEWGIEYERKRHIEASKHCCGDPIMDDAKDAHYAVR